MAATILCIFAFILTFNLLRARYSRGFNKFNGPFLASITDLWKLWYAFTGSQKQLYVDIHQKYGDIVRVGPNELSFADPRAIRDIYGPGGGSQKARSPSRPPGVESSRLTSAVAVQRIQRHICTCPGCH